MLLLTGIVDTQSRAGCEGRGKKVRSRAPPS